MERAWSLAWHRTQLPGLISSNSCRWNSLAIDLPSTVAVRSGRLRPAGKDEGSSKAGRLAAAFGLGVVVFSVARLFKRFLSLSCWALVLGVLVGRDFVTSCSRSSVMGVLTPLNWGGFEQRSMIVRKRSKFHIKFPLRSFKFRSSPMHGHSKRVVS